MLVLSKVKLPWTVWLLVIVRLGILTVPEPNVTGLLVVVLMFRVEADVKSMTGLVAVKLVFTLFKVTVPVPVAKVFVPVMVVAPFRDTAPVLVLNVPEAAEKSRELAAPAAVKVLPEERTVLELRLILPIGATLIFPEVVVCKETSAALAFNVIVEPVI